MRPASAQGVTRSWLTATTTPHAVAEDEALAARAEAEADRTYEFSELLVDVLGVTDVRASCRQRVTHQRT